MQQQRLRIGDHEQVAAVVIKGKGMMPPRGTAATDADVKAAVEYILSQMK